MIGELFANGAVQVKITLLPMTEVAGATGIAGM